MRRDQAERYARHVLLPEIGERGQSAILAATARLEMQPGDSRAEWVAAIYLAAAGVGQIVLVNARGGQRADVAAHNPDTHVVDEGGGRAVICPPRPEWWPTAVGDDEALAFYTGGCAAAQWLADATR